MAFSFRPLKFVKREIQYSWCTLGRIFRFTVCRDHTVNNLVSFSGGLGLETVYPDRFFVGFLSPSIQMLNKATCIHVLFTSLLTKHPIFRHYILRY